MKGSKNAYGICDRTGFRYKLDDLVYESVNGTRTGLRIGKNVSDKDHPQNFIGRVKTSDDQSLRDPRPDTSPGSGLHGWNPVGNDAQFMVGYVGTVTVKTE